MRQIGANEEQQDVQKKLGTWYGDSDGPMGRECRQAKADQQKGQRNAAFPNDMHDAQVMRHRLYAGARRNSTSSANEHNNVMPTEYSTAVCRISST